MNKLQKIIAAIVAILGIGGGVAYSQLGGAGEVPASVDDVRIVEVGRLNPVIIFTAATASPANLCSSRVISNPAQALVLKFATTAEAVLNNNRKAGPLLTGSSGVVQAASTTVNYDAKVYGCGFVSALGAEASSSITVTEFK